MAKKIHLAAFLEHADFREPLGIMACHPTFIPSGLPRSYLFPVIHYRDIYCVLEDKPLQLEDLPKLLLPRQKQDDIKELVRSITKNRPLTRLINK